MTLGFAAFEYAQGRYIPKLALPKWSVRDLPPLETGEKRPSMVNGIADLIVSVLMIVWLLAVPNHPYLIIGPGAKMVHGMPFGVTPEWHVFYWQIIGLLIAMLPLKVAMLLPPLRRVRGWLQLAVNGMGILILVVMVQVRSFFVAGNEISAEGVAYTASHENHSCPLLRDVGCDKRKQFCPDGRQPWRVDTAYCGDDPGLEQCAGADGAVGAQAGQQVMAHGGRCDQDCRWQEWHGLGERHRGHGCRAFEGRSGEARGRWSVSSRSL
jgi:hypothetical protein